MQIRDYWAVLAKRWWVFLLVAAVASTSAYVYSKSQRPIFRSTAFVRIEPGRMDWGLTLVGQAIMRQYSRMMSTSYVLDRVNEELQLDLTAEQLRAKVIVAPVVEDLLLQIDVDDPDPGNAQRIAKAMARAFVEDQVVRMAPQEPRDRVNVFMLDEPSPATLNRPKTRVNVMAGAVLGLLVGGLLAFVLEYLDDTIKSVEDVDRWVRLPTVGTIPQFSAAESRRGQKPSPSQGWREGHAAHES